MSSPEHIAVQFMQARRGARALTGYPGEVPGDLSLAYRCQEVEIDNWNDRLLGWKVARIGAQWQSQYPEERLIGPVFARNMHVAATDEVVACPVFADGFAAVEAEIGVYVRADAPAGKTDWTPQSAADQVAQMCIGVEVASSPLATLNDLGPGAVISDFGNNWGVIAGALVDDWQSLRQDLEVETFIDDLSVGRATIAIPDTPLSALAFALNKAAQRGRPLRKGDYISTGMITGVHDIRIGQSSRLTFGRYGEIHCRMIRAEALA